MNIPVRMVGGKILVRPYSQDHNVEETESGLLVGESAIRALREDGIQFTSDEAPIGGIVVSVGTHYCEDCERKSPLPFEAGQLVAFRKEAGTTLDLNGERFYVLLPDDILGEILPMESVND